MCCVYHVMYKYCAVYTMLCVIIVLCIPCYVSVLCCVCHVIYQYCAVYTMLCISIVLWIPCYLSVLCCGYHVMYKYCAVYAILCISIVLCMPCYVSLLSCVYHVISVSLLMCYVFHVLYHFASWCMHVIQLQSVPINIQQNATKKYIKLISIQLTAFQTGVTRLI